MMVIDGNQKNKRSVCMATDAGFIEYPSLPGTLKTGCTKSPAFKSRFCSQHTPRICTSRPKYLAADDLETCIDKAETTTDTTPKDVPVIELLLEKKCTRNGEYYKVIMNNVHESHACGFHDS